MKPVTQYLTKAAEVERVRSAAEAVQRGQCRWLSAQWQKRQDSEDQQVNNSRRTKMENRTKLEERKRQLKLHADFISGLKRLGFKQISLASGWPVYCKWAHSGEEFSAIRLYSEEKSGGFKQYKVFFHLPTRRVIEDMKTSDTNLIGSWPDWLRENLDFLCELAKKDRLNRDLQDKIAIALEKARPELEKELDDDSSKG